MNLGIEKMFGKLAPGMCRLSMNGKIAVKTSNGYKAYNVKTGKLTNCDSFVFDIGNDMFFLLPTNKVKVGDIILVNGKPVCVKAAKDNEITALNYEDSTIVTIVPERHVFLGNTYFYSKIVSMFGNVTGKSNGMQSIMKYMMMSEMMKGSSTDTMSTSFGGMNPMMLMMMGGGTDIFGGMFDEIGAGMMDCMTDDSTDDESEEE